MKKSKSKHNIKSQLGGFYRSFDLFGSPVGFKVDNKDSFTSIMGATMSLLIAAIILTYGSGKFLKMSERADTSFQ